MVSFRRFVLALAVLALFTGLVSAQTVIGGSGSVGGALVCTANVSNPTQVRAEGHAELLGDIVIACTGGAAPTGGAVPTANITVTLANTYVTSRNFSNGLSDALLLIDEPNAPGGTGLPFVACASNVGGGSKLVGAGLGGCATVVGTVTLPTPLTYTPPGTATPVTLTTATEAVLPGTSTVPNVFQGIVPAGSNQVIFNGVPILAPVTAGLSRVFRITNIRASAAQLSGGGTFQGTTSILAGITISNGLLVQSPVLTTANVFTGLTTLVRNAGGNGNGSSITGSGALLQCQTSSIAAAAVLRFTEGFASAFKTRIAPTATLSGAGTPAGTLIPSTTFTQNVPGLVYGGSESGFIQPVEGGTAGLADFGTRLKATFNNIPTGVTIYVTTTNVNATGGTNTNLLASGFNTSSLNGLLSNAIPVNTTTSLLAGLVIGESAGAQGSGGGQTGFLPLLPATNNTAGATMTALTPDVNGTATAVWEILTANPAAPESAEFGVYYSFTGNQIAGTPQVNPAATVSMSFAPTVATYNGSTAIPRFAPASTSTTLINVVLCQTTLLFPFVNTAPGFDTGISIANTSADTQGTKNQTGACTLNFFGSGAGTTTSAPFPSAGGNIAPGTLNAEQVSNIRNGFTGYVIAVCNFQLAHGYALFSDTGIRNWATGYLGLVITQTGGRVGAEGLSQ